MAEDRLEITEVDRHIEVVSRKLLRRNRNRSVPRMTVNEPALARVLKLPVCRVKIAVGDKLFHGDLPDAIAMRFEYPVTA